MTASVSFMAYGHPNVLATHRNTIEFTKEDFLTKEGDCILGVNADFSAEALREFVKECERDFVEVEIRCGDFTEIIMGKLNKGFNDNKAIVIRKSNFVSERTLVTEADKAACDLNREMVDSIRKEECVVVTMREIEGMFL